MREFKCQASGFTHSVLGKATRKRVKKKDRGNYIWIGEKGVGRRLKGYSAVVTEEYPQKRDQAKLRGIPLVVSAHSLNEIGNGDIILVEPKKGFITVLYERSSNHNAIFVTSRCNSACIICPQPPKQDPKDQDVFNRHLVELIAPGPENLALTGGEPTVLGDELISLVKLCRDKLPGTRLLLLTNGRKLKKLDYVGRLVSAGYPKLSVGVPLYADTGEKHDEIMGVRGAFAEAIQGIHNLGLYEIPVEVRIVVLRTNFDRLTSIADFIYRNITFACHVAFMGLELCGSALDNLDKIWIDPYDYKEQLFEACRFLHRRSISVSIYNHQLCILEKELWPIARRSISEWKNIFLPGCENCCMREDCGGFFASALNKHSQHISPMKSLA